MTWRPREALIWLREISLDPVGGLGVLFATLGGGLFAVFLALSLLGFPFSPYIGIFIYVALPAILVAGLALLPIAHFRLSKRRSGGRLPHFDFENPRHLRRLGIFGLLTVANVCIFGFAGYGAYHVSETNEFCGLVCHTVMEPEWTAYQASPHARVKCVECHIGPGAGWFVKSKLSGARQVWAVATGRYRRPVPTPIEDLRPARETCEQCHWPEKFHGDVLQVRRHYASDLENTEKTTVLVLKIRGGNREGEDGGGIHWHTNPRNRVSYVAVDERREEIPYVKLERQNGEVVEYFAGDPEEVRASIAGRPERVMDCMDCHNRPTHAFELPEQAVDHALADGRLDRSIPYLRREAERALRSDVEPHADPVAAMRAALDEFYATDPGIAGSVAPSALDAAAGELAAIRGRNVFPKMEIDWGTYPIFLGHGDDFEGGCFRCHDGGHETPDGETISDDCETCHTIVAEEETDPAVLSTLYGS
jgi:hypothetical protein